MQWPRRLNPKNLLFSLTVISIFKNRPGSDGHLPLIGDVIEKPDWQTICPPGSCPEGSMMKTDCTCTAPEDPCSACPFDTYCQLSSTLMCIDCTCGFCDSKESDCCEFNGVNNCKSAGGAADNKECTMQNDFFPAFEGAGNLCGGVEIFRTAVPNGCGCKPNSDSPCTYNKEWGEKPNKCFLCTANDLSIQNVSQNVTEEVACLLRRPP